VSRSWCSALPHGVRLAVQVSPNAKKTEVIGVLDEALKLKLQAQPIEGKANEALLRYLAGVLKLPRSAIAITHGHSNKKKLLEITAAGLTPEAVEQLLLDQAGSL
jgi:uncharacterized protein (TIGR00251 family)